MTPYDLLRDKCNELLPIDMGECWTCNKCDNRMFSCGFRRAELTITDVLMALSKVTTQGTAIFCISDQGVLWQPEVSPYGNATFNLAAPLSDPSNAAACEAVLALLDSKKV